VDGFALGAGFAESGFGVRERGRGGGGGGGGKGADSAACVIVVTVVVIGGSDTCDELDVPGPDALAAPSTSHCPGEPSPGEPLFIGGRASSGGTLGGAVRGGGGCGDAKLVDGGDFEGGGTAEAFPWLEAERR